MAQTEKLRISFYILGSIFILILLVLIAIIFSGVISSQTSSLLKSIQVSTKSSTSPCGEYTSLDPISNMCIPDEGKLISSLIESGNIKINYDNKIYYDPMLKFTKIIPAPSWYTKWTDIGGPLVCKTSYFAGNTFAGNINRLDLNMKYAGVYENKTCCFKYPEYNPSACFVNNNITTNDQAVQELNSQQYSAEHIKYIFSSDIDQCKQGYCFVNGICVSPYQVTGDPKKTCCPPCIYVPTSEGGCAGQFSCDESNPCKNERKVEYPGTKIECSTMIETSPQCTSSSKQEDECWSPNNKDTSKRQPYKYISANYDTTCTEKTLCDSYNGKNEFDCALSCMTDNISQKECSKRCLPKLWRWYPVFANVGGQTKTFRGFMQSDELMQDLPDSTPPLMYCPPDTCVYDRDFGKDPKLTNCTDCYNCSVRRSEDNPIENNSGCKGCKQCILEIINVDSGDCGEQTKTLVCQDKLTPCESCKKYTTYFGPFVNYSDEYICDRCSVDDINKSCKFYTRVPFANDPTNSDLTKRVTLRPEVKVYNCSGTNPYSISL